MTAWLRATATGRSAATAISRATRWHRWSPSGNWHEIDRAIIVLIGVVAYALVTELIIKPMVLRYAVSYIPTVLLAFFYVWSTSFRENLAQSAYMDIWINFTSMFVIFCIVHFIVYKCRKKKETMK